MQAPPSPPRRGSALLAALLMLGVLTGFAVFQQYLARQAGVVVERAHLSALASLQGRSGVEELVQQVVERSNDPATELYAALRDALRRDFDEIDLTPFLDPPEYPIHPTWGRQGAAPGADLQASIVEYRARLRAPHYPEADPPTEEYVAALTLSTIAEAASPRGRVQRRASATFELRALLTAPPRPLDQVGLFVQNAGALVDLGGVDQHRRLLIEDHEAFRQRLEQVAATQPGELGERLAAMAASFRDLEFLQEHAPRVEGAADSILLGPLHAPTLTGAQLDLMHQLRQLRADRQAKRAAFEAATTDPAALEQAAYEVVSALGRELSQLTLFASRVAVLAADAPLVTDQLAPYFTRLTPEYFRRRVHLRLPADDPLVTRWAAGEASLSGVVELTAAGGELRITGRPRGQLILVASGQPIRLEGEPEPEGEPAEPESPRRDRLVIVSFGADVTVSGEAQAAVLMLPAEGGGGPGRFELRPGATLLGAVAVADAQPGKISLSGRLVYDGGLQAPYTEADADAAERTRDDPYTIVMSPTPLF